MGTRRPIEHCDFPLFETSCRHLRPTNRHTGGIGVPCLEVPGAPFGVVTKSRVVFSVFFPNFLGLAMVKTHNWQDRTRDLLLRGHTFDQLS